VPIPLIDANRSGILAPHLRTSNFDEDGILSRIHSTPQYRTAFLAAVAALLLLPLAAQAQESYTFTVSGLAGVGGATNGDRGDGVDNTSYQLAFSLVTQPKTHVGLRIGSIDLESDEGFGGGGAFTDTDLTYVTVSGEYRYSYAWYESGVYFGLGAYRLEGVSLLDGSALDNTSAGLVLGLTGEFDLTKRFAFLVELAGHFTGLDEASTFITVQAGVSFHF